MIREKPGAVSWRINEYNQFWSIETQNVTKELKKVTLASGGNLKGSANSGVTCQRRSEGT